MSYKYCEENIPGTWRFMQDGAPCHRVSSVSSFLARHDNEKIDWPPYSPDLNTIEKRLAMDEANSGD
jgi:transposase